MILTTTANASMQPIHERMPVILEHNEQIEWLRDEGFARYVIEREGPQLEARLV